jgi:hypothetical protein
VTRWRFGIALLLVVGVIAGYLAFRNGSRQSEAEPPPVADRAATQTWLAGPGAVVSKFAAATDTLLDQPPSGQQDCQLWAEANLDSLGAPSATVEAISSSPDQVTAEIALAHFDVTVRWLAGCVQETADGPSIEEVRTTGRRLDDRLIEIRS